MESKLSTRESAVNDFLKEKLTPYGLSYDLSVNDDSSDDCTDFMVEIRHKYATKPHCAIIRSNDLNDIPQSGGLEINVGEDFYPVGDGLFEMMLFMDLFLDNTPES